MIKLVKMVMNLSRVELGDLSIYFSYETPIAFIKEGELTITENEWGPTTGRHLNLIDTDKKKRVSHTSFMLMLEELI